MSAPADSLKSGVLRVLHLEDHPRDLELVAGWLEDEGLCCDITSVQTASEFQSALQQTPLHLIISDYQLPGFDGLKALRMARQRLPDVPFILFSGTIGEELAVNSLKQGATDYVLKQKPQRLMAAIQHALAQAKEHAKRKEAERKIQAQAALLDKAQDAIMVWDMEGRITFWNRSAERIYGWSAAEALGQAAEQLLFREGGSQASAALLLLSQRGEWLGELNQVRRDGTPLVVESRWTLLRDGQDIPEARLIINTDVTERKRLEAQFLRAQRMESIGALAGGIAHDLNNILAPILMAAELLSEELPGEDRTKLLVTVKACAQRGSEMVKQILTFARGAGGQASLLQIKPLAAEMVRLAKDTFPRSIRIQTKVDPGLPAIMGNATQLHQVLLNLCVNARDAMPDRGELRLSASLIELKEYVVKGELQPVSGSYVVLSVSDTGHGMSPEVLGKVFQPFFTTKAVGKGTGLGLSTVAGIAKSHGGFVEVWSQVARGTTFKVYLPAAPTEAVPAPDEKTAAPTMGRGEKVLIVDDENAILEMTREILEASNYQVLMAHNGAEAVAIYQRHRGEVQAVITDMMMPIVDGPTLIRALQKVDPQVKVIGISGLGSEAVLSKAGKLSVRTFLKKPYSSASLLGSLREVINEEV